MKPFIGYVAGNGKTVASRLGSLRTGITAFVATRDQGVKIYLSRRDDVDWVEIFLERNLGRGVYMELVSCPLSELAVTLGKDSSAATE